MKRKVKGTLLTILVLLAMVFAMMPMTSQTAHAAIRQMTENGITYHLDDKTFLATVFDADNNLQEKVTIPDKVYMVLGGQQRAFTVTAIGEYAFQRCTNLTSVEIPETVTSIGGYAFCETGLTRITIPNSVTTMGSFLFRDSPLSKVIYKGSKEQWDAMSDRHRLWAGEEGLEVVYTIMEVPSPVEGLMYNGDTQAGVEPNDGYTLTDSTAINAGSYTAEATPVEGFKWVDGTTETKTIDWEIERASLTIKPKDQTYTYNGGTRGPGEKLYAGAKEIAQYIDAQGLAPGDNVQSVGVSGQGVELGEYELTAGSATITDEGNNEINDNYNINYEKGKMFIVKKVLNVTVNGSSSSKVYNGKKQSYTGKVTARCDDPDFDSGKFSYAGTLTVEGINAGSYTKTPKEADCHYDTEIYDIIWSIGDPVRLKISKATIKVSVPAGKTFTYDGKAHTGVAAGSKYTLSGTVKATNAGNYTAKATLKSDPNYAYKWSDGTTAAKNIKWKINKAEVKVAVPAGKTFTYNGNAKTGVAAGSKYTLSGTVKATKAGTYKAKATLKTHANYTYKWSDGTTAAKTITWKINKAANTLAVKAKSATVKYSAVKKKSQALAISKLISFDKNGQGELTYAKVSGSKKITINKTTGKVTISKGIAKGTYEVKVKVKAAGNANYKASAWKTVTFKVKVK